MTYKRCCCTGRQFLLSWSKTQVDKPEWNGQYGEGEAGTQGHDFLVISRWSFPFAAVTQGKHDETKDSKQKMFK